MVTRQFVTRLNLDHANSSMKFPVVHFLAAPRLLEWTIHPIQGQKPRRASVQNSWARKKHKMKTMWKLWSGVFVCVVLPITTYVIDIIIAVNVVEQKVYKEKLSYYHDFTNKDNLPIPKTETILGYTYNLTDTFLGDVSKLKKIFSRNFLRREFSISFKIRNKKNFWSF